MIKRMIKAHPTQDRMARQATPSWVSRRATSSGRRVDAVEADHLGRIPKDPKPADCLGRVAGSVTLIRVAFVVFAVTGIGELVYLILWVVIPKAPV
jgi:hypothetical protein